MIRFIWNEARKRGSRTLLLILAILIVSAAFGLLLSAAETSKVTIDQEMARYWRTTYDILVRPSGSRSSIEEEYGLVEPNHLSGIWGGITFEQYEAIRGIPGAELAAPIAMLGYNSAWGAAEEMPLPPGPGVYRLEERLLVNDGTPLSASPRLRRKTYYFFDRDPRSIARDPSLPHHVGDLLVNNPSSAVHGSLEFPFLMAAVSLLVAGITTAEGLLVSALDRRREIGVLKAMGWRNREVLRLFLVEGATLGLLGGLAGVGVGALSMAIMFERAPTAWAQILLVGLAVPSLVGLSAAALPGHIAARTSPSEAVRYE